MSNYPGQVGGVSPVHEAFLAAQEAMAQLRAAQLYNRNITIGTSSAVVKAFAAWEAYEEACRTAGVAMPEGVQPVVNVTGGVIGYAVDHNGPPIHVQTMVVAGAGSVGNDLGGKERK